MSVQLEREPPQLLQLDTGSDTVTVLMWLNASRVVTAAILKKGEARLRSRTLLSTAVPIEDLEDGVEVDPETLGLQLPGVSLGVATPANLASAREWFQLHGVDVREGVVVSAAVLALPAHPRDCNTIRAALAERARHIGAHPSELARARRVAMQQLRAGASTGWAVVQGQRVLRGAEPATRPGGAA